MDRGSCLGPCRPLRGMLGTVRDGRGRAPTRLWQSARRCRRSALENKRFAGRSISTWACWRTSNGIGGRPRAAFGKLSASARRPTSRPASGTSRAGAVAAKLYYGRRETGRNREAIDLYASWETACWSPRLRHLASGTAAKMDEASNKPLRRLAFFVEFGDS